MSNQPKPTTGEWTPEYVQAIADKANISDQNQAIADAHNAALAAERERWRNQSWRELQHDLSAVNQQLREQLAAAQAAMERCFHFGMDATKADVLELLSKTLHRDTAALAAERAAAVLDSKLREQQLVELLREALNRLGNTAFPSLSARIVSQLAKVKEGK